MKYTYSGSIPRVRKVMITNMISANKDVYINKICRKHFVPVVPYLTAAYVNKAPAYQWTQHHVECNDW